MTNCKGCGKKITWGETEEGKMIPLDPRPPVYEVWMRANDGKTFIKRRTDCYVSHFATCPNANEFSGSKRKEQDDGNAR